MDAEKFCFEIKSEIKEIRKIFYFTYFHSGDSIKSRKRVYTEYLIGIIVLAVFVPYFYRASITLGNVMLIIMLMFCYLFYILPFQYSSREMLKKNKLSFQEAKVLFYDQYYLLEFKNPMNEKFEFKYHYEDNEGILIMDYRNSYVIITPVHSFTLNQKDISNQEDFKAFLVNDAKIDIMQVKYNSYLPEGYFNKISSLYTKE